MNLLNKIIFVLWFVCCCNFSLAQGCKATLSIQIDTDSTKLFIDDVFFGEGNKFAAELDTGRHVIRLQHNLWKWNSNLISDTLNITDCKEYSYKYSFSNKVLLNTDPQDVYVFKDDSLVGFTPLLIKSFNGDLNLKKTDYASQTTNFNEISVGAKPVLQFVGEEKGKDFYETVWFKVLVSSAIVLGATTAYYKLEADKKFDEYQVTGDPALLEQTDKYDLISGVTFVAMQINFGLILYFFLAD